MVDVATLLSAAFTLFAGGGVIFEAGRRIGKSSEQQESTKTDVNELDEKIESKFTELEQQLAIQQHRRVKREGVIIRWLENIHVAVSDKVTDVDRPPEVEEDIDIDIGDYPSPDKGSDGGD